MTRKFLRKFAFTVKWFWIRFQVLHKSLKLLYCGIFYLQKGEKIDSTFTYRALQLKSGSLSVVN